MNFNKLVFILLLLIIQLTQPANQQATSSHREEFVTEIVYEYYEVSGDEEAGPSPPGDRVPLPLAPLPPGAPKSVLPPAPPVPPAVPQRTVLPLAPPAAPARLLQPSEPKVAKPPFILPQVDTRNIVVQPPTQPAPPAPRNPVTHFPRNLAAPPATLALVIAPKTNLDIIAENQPVVFGITSLPASRFVGVEKAKPAPPQPFQNNNNFFGSVWAPWSAWGLCQSQTQMRVRACNTVVGFSCFGTNVERKSCIETSDDRPVLLFEPSDFVTQPAVIDGMHFLAVENKPQEVAQLDRLAQAKKKNRGKNANIPTAAPGIPTAPPPPDEGTAPPPPPDDGSSLPPTLAPPTDATALSAPTEAVTPLATTIAPPTPLPTTVVLSTLPVTSPITLPVTVGQTQSPAPPPPTQAPFTQAPFGQVLTFVPLNPDQGLQPPNGFQPASGPQVIPQIPAPIDMSNFVWNGESTFPPFNYIQIQPQPGSELGTGDNGPAPVPANAYGNNKNWGQQSGFNRGAPINDAANWNQWTSWSGCQCGRQSRTRTCDFNNAALTTGCAGSSYQIIQCGSGGCSLTGGVPLPTIDFGSPLLPGAYAPSFQAPGYNPGQIPASSYSSSGIYRNFPKPAGSDYGPPASPYQAGPPLPAPAPPIYGAVNNYYPPPPTSGPDFFNVWLDGVWQPTAVFKPTLPTTPRPPVVEYGVYGSKYGIGFQPGQIQPPPPIAPAETTPLPIESPPTILATDTTPLSTASTTAAAETSTVQPPSQLSGTESTVGTTEEEEEETTIAVSLTGTFPSPVATGTAQTPPATGTAPPPPPEKRQAKLKGTTASPVKKVNRKPH